MDVIEYITLFFGIEFHHSTGFFSICSRMRAEGGIVVGSAGSIHPKVVQSVFGVAGCTIVLYYYEQVIAFLDFADGQEDTSVSITFRSTPSAYMSDFVDDALSPYPACSGAAKSLVPR